MTTRLYVFGSTFKVLPKTILIQYILVVKQTALKTITIPFLFKNSYNEKSLVYH